MREEGFIDVPGGRAWYVRLGAGDATPILMLHGGPGAGHDCIAPLGDHVSHLEEPEAYLAAVRGFLA